MAKLKLVQVFDPIGDWAENPSTQKELVRRIGPKADRIPWSSKVEIFTDGKRQYAKFKGFKGRNYLVRIDGFFTHYLKRVRGTEEHDVETLRHYYLFTEEHGKMISSLAPIGIGETEEGQAFAWGRNPNMLQESAIPIYFNEDYYNPEEY